MKRILGALLHRERIALVDLSQAEPRARLTEAHEIGHGIIPWHEAAFQLDDKERLLGATRDRLEQGAYLAGGHLIFQGLHFWKRAPQDPDVMRHGRHGEPECLGDLAVTGRVALAPPELLDELKDPAPRPFAVIPASTAVSHAVPIE